MANNIEEAIAQHIATLEGWTTGTNIFIGPLPAIGNGVPAYCIGVIKYGSSGPNRRFKPGNDTKNENVQVRIRSNPRDYQATSAFVQTLWDHLDRTSLDDDDDPSYLAWDLLCDGSSAKYLGMAPDGTSQWSIDISVRDHRQSDAIKQTLPKAPDAIAAALNRIILTEAGTVVYVGDGELVLKS